MRGTYTFYEDVDVDAAVLCNEFGLTYAELMEEPTEHLLLRLDHKEEERASEADAYKKIGS